MNRYVLDASVIVKWLIPESPTEPDVEQVLALFAGLRDNTISVRPPTLAATLTFNHFVSQGNFMTQFSCKRTILFGDCDPAGIIYTPRVAYFVVEAAHEFISHSLGAPGLRAILAMGILPPARALSIEFLAPMVWDDEIDIAVSCRDIKTSSFRQRRQDIHSVGPGQTWMSQLVRFLRWGDGIEDVPLVECSYPTFYF